MKPIIRLKQADYKQESGIIRKFPIITIYYDENATFPYVAKCNEEGWIRNVTEKSKTLKNLIKRLNTYVFCVEYRKGRYLAEKTIGSNIEFLDTTFKKELI